MPESFLFLHSIPRQNFSAGDISRYEWRATGAIFPSSCYPVSFFAVVRPRDLSLAAPSLFLRHPRAASPPAASAASRRQEEVIAPRRCASARRARARTILPRSRSENPDFRVYIFAGAARPGTRSARFTRGYSLQYRRVRRLFLLWFIASGAVRERPPPRTLARSYVPEDYNGRDIFLESNILPPLPAYSSLFACGLSSVTANCSCATGCSSAIIIRDIRPAVTRGQCVFGARRRQLESGVT